MDIHLDKRDERLISALVKDARTPIKQLAKEVQLSRQATAKRVERLLEQGTIRSFETRLNLEALGFVHYEVMFSVRGLSGERRKRMLAYFVDHPFSRWVGECIGPYDLRVTFAVTDHHHMERVTSDIFAAFGGEIIQYTVSAVVGIPKHLPHDLHKRPFEPLEARPKAVASLDELDIKLLELLSRDPQATLLKLSQGADSSIETVRRRMKRLEQDRIILHYSANIDPEHIGKLWYILYLNFSSLDDGIKRKLVEFSRVRHFVSNSYLMLGGWHLHMTVNGETMRDIADHLQEIKETFSGSLTQYLPLTVTAAHKYPKVPWGIFEYLRAQHKS